MCAWRRVIFSEKMPIACESCVFFRAFAGYRAFFAFSELQARGGAQGGGDGGEHGDDEVQDFLPEFFLHNS